MAPERAKPSRAVLTSCSVQELWSLVGRDHLGAREELFERTRRHLMVRAVRRTPSWADPEDLVQDTLVKIMVRWETYDPGRSGFLTWARLLLDGTIAEYWRKTLRRRGASTGDEAGRHREATDGQTPAGTDPCDPAAHAELDVVPLRLLLDHYVRSRPSREEGAVVHGVFALGLRNVDARVLAGPRSGSVDRWVGNARCALASALADRPAA